MAGRRRERARRARRPFQWQQSSPWAPSALGYGPALLSRPAVIVFLGVNGHERAHAVVTEAAQLCAAQLVLARLRGLEPDTDVHAGNRVLLDAERGDEERMDGILGRERRHHGLVDRNVELPAYGVVVRRTDFSIGAG